MSDQRVISFLGCSSSCCCFEGEVVVVGGGVCVHSVPVHEDTGFTQ